MTPKLDWKAPAAQAANKENRSKAVFFIVRDIFVCKQRACKGFFPLKMAVYVIFTLPIVF